MQQFLRTLAPGKHHTQESVRADRYSAGRVHAWLGSADHLCAILAGARAGKNGNGRKATWPRETRFLMLSSVYQKRKAIKLGAMEMILSLAGIPSALPI
jgi:hypothetical protein